MLFVRGQLTHAHNLFDCPLKPIKIFCYVFSVGPQGDFRWASSATSSTLPKDRFLHGTVNVCTKREDFAPKRKTFVQRPDGVPRSAFFRDVRAKQSSRPGSAHWQRKLRTAQPMGSLFVSCLCTWFYLLFFSFLFFSFSVVINNDILSFLSTISQTLLIAPVRPVHPEICLWRTPVECEIHALICGSIIQVQVSLFTFLSSRFFHHIHHISLIVIFFHHDCYTYLVFIWFFFKFFFHFPVLASYLVAAASLDSLSF